MAGNVNDVLNNMLSEEQLSSLRRALSDANPAVKQNNSTGSGTPSGRYTSIEEEVRARFRPGAGSGGRQGGAASFLANFTRYLY